jgi:hypothetical protein
MPSYEAKGIYSGEDLAINSREHAQLQNYFANHVYRIFEDKNNYQKY